MRVAGVDVDPGLAKTWTTWFAPTRQPFFVASAADAPDGSAVDIDRADLTDELRDTYRVWGMAERGTLIWLDEAAFGELARQQRAALVREQVRRRRGAVPSVRRWEQLIGGDRLRAQADGHRFVWWPSLIRGHEDLVLTDLITEECGTSEHRHVSSSTWSRCAEALPGARSMAGTFASSSGPNCFGTVMRAAGDDEPTRWVTTEPFDEWLSARCVPGGTDRDVGTVLVWRNRTAQPTHAAITLGDGWALEKPSQTWWTPRVVLPVGSLIATNRSAGQRLERHQLTGGGTARTRSR